MKQISQPAASGVACQNGKTDSLGDATAPMKKLRFSLIGWHGRENAGDDVFILVLSKWFAQSLCASHVLVTGSAGRLPRVAAESKIKLEGMLSDKPEGRIKRVLREPTFLFGKDAVVFGAGSIFSVRRFAWLSTQLLALRCLRWLRIIDTPVAAIGVSIGPFRKSFDSYWCKRALKLFDVVMVRDQGSAEIGEQFGLKNLISSFDLALALPHFFSIPKRAPDQAPSAAPVIGFSLVDRDAELGRPEIDKKKNDSLFNALQSISAVHPNVRFQGFVFCNDPHRGDLETTQAMLRRLEDVGCHAEIVLYNNDPLELIEKIAQADVMICNRMHSFVFSCLTRTPAIMISYAPKMLEFARTVGVPDWLQFSHRDLQTEQVQETVEKLLCEPRSPCDEERLDKCSKALVSQLEEAARLIRSKGAGRLDGAPV